MDRESFWERVKTEGIFQLHSLILGGQLNFTFNASEVWGEKACLNPLQKIFKDLFQSMDIIDIGKSPILIT